MQRWPSKSPRRDARLQCTSFPFQVGSEKELACQGRKANTEALIDLRTSSARRRLSEGDLKRERDREGLPGISSPGAVPRAYLTSRRTLSRRSVCNLGQVRSEEMGFYKHTRLYKEGVKSLKSPLNDTPCSRCSCSFRLSVLWS